MAKEAFKVVMAGILFLCALWTACYLSFKHAFLEPKPVPVVTSSTVVPPADIPKCWYRRKQEPGATVSFLPGTPPMVCETSERGHDCWPMGYASCSGGR